VYGQARACRACGEPATCSVCGGSIVIEDGAPACHGCGAPGRCANCESSRFGIERGGTERVAEWAGRMTPLPVEIEAADGSFHRPGDRRVLVGTARSVNDLGPLSLDLVAILDPDRALIRPGVHAAERAVATWMEAGAWARPRAEGGRILVQTRRPGHPALQALIRWDPIPFLLQESRRRWDAGFPADYYAYRIDGPPPPDGSLDGMGSGLAEALRGAGAATVVSTIREDRTVCLVAVPPAKAAAFRRAVIDLAAEGAVTRVEAEPTL
jgi:primosomal protein N' (replication factor Y) (superfamily II helicase)